MSTYTHLLFDLDDTILDFQANEAQALERTFKRYHIPMTNDNLATYHRINKALWKAYERGEIARNDIFVKRYTQFFELIHCQADGIEANRFYLDCLNDGHKLMPHAKDVLQQLTAKNYHLEVVTNGVGQTQRIRLKEAGIALYFDHLYISEEVGHQKPDCRFFEYVLKDLQVNRQQCVIIGDTLSSDILGGQRMAIDTIWYNPSYQSKDPEITPTHEIHDLLELERYL